MYYNILMKPSSRTALLLHADVSKSSPGLAMTSVRFFEYDPCGREVVWSFIKFVIIYCGNVLVVSLLYVKKKSPFFIGQIY